MSQSYKYFHQYSPSALSRTNRFYQEKSNGACFRKHQGKRPPIGGPVGPSTASISVSRGPRLTPPRPALPDAACAFHAGSVQNLLEKFVSGEKIIRNSEYINSLDLTGQELAVDRLDDQAHVTPRNRARKDTYANGQHYDAPPEQHCLSFLAIEKLDLPLDKIPN
jgi:hypothetical protein